MMAAVQDACSGVDLVCLIRDAAVSTGNGDRFVLTPGQTVGEAGAVIAKQDR